MLLSDRDDVALRLALKPKSWPGIVQQHLLLAIEPQQDDRWLDRQFADKSVTRASLDEALSRIARSQAELRAAHLRYHLAMVELLSPAQTARYAELRGYK